MEEAKEERHQRHRVHDGKDAKVRRQGEEDHRAARASLLQGTGGVFPRNVGHSDTPRNTHTYLQCTATSSSSSAYPSEISLRRLKINFACKHANAFGPTVDPCVGAIQSAWAAANLDSDPRQGGAGEKPPAVAVQQLALMLLFLVSVILVLPSFGVRPELPSMFHPRSLVDS